MWGSEVQFYGDCTDLAAQLERFAQRGPVRFTEKLSALNSRSVQFDDPKMLMRFVATPERRHGEIFLAEDCQHELNFEEVRMQDGSGTKWSLHQIYNPHSVVIRLGGYAEPETLIATSVNTTGETPRAKEMFRDFKRSITRHAKLVHGFYVLPGALEKLKSGWRLTPEVEYSRTLDLQRPDE